jgi:hypothetical protein
MSSTPRRLQQRFDYSETLFCSGATIRVERGESAGMIAMRQPLRNLFHTFSSEELGYRIR